MYDAIEFIQYENKYFENLLEIFREAYDDDSIMATGDEYEYRKSPKKDLECIINSSTNGEIFIWKNKIIGGLFVDESEQKIEIMSIFIDPIYHNLEIGTQILKQKILKNSKNVFVNVPLYSERLMYFFTKKCDFTIDNKNSYFIDGFLRYVKRSV